MLLDHFNATVEQILSYSSVINYENILLFFSIVLFFILGRNFISSIVTKIFQLIGQRFNFDVTLLESFRKPTVFAIISFVIFIAYVTFLESYKVKLDIVFFKIIDVAKILTVFWFIYNFLDYFIPQIIKHKKGRPNSHFSNNVVVFLLKISRIVITFLALIAILKEFNVNLVALLAGFGLAGIAFALAAQDTLKNLFSSVTIILDNVFIEGDEIKIDNVEGVIEYIGFRSTVIKTKNHSLVFVPNSKFSDSVVTNISKVPYTNLIISIILRRPITKELINKILDDIRSYTKEHLDFDESQQMISIKSYSSNEIEILCEFVLKIIDDTAITTLKSYTLEKLAEIIENNKTEFRSIS